MNHLLQMRLIGTSTSETNSCSRIIAFGDAFIVVRSSLSLPYKGRWPKGRRGWLVVGALVGRAGRRPQFAVRKTMPHGPVWCMADYSRRAASHCCPFWQPSCAFRWSTPDGPKRPLGQPLRTRPQAVDYLLSPGCDFVGDVL